MNEEHIENLLRQAPPVRVPQNLLGKLQGGIKLPPQPATRSNGITNHGWLKRWIPALSFAAFFVTCLVVVGVQTNVLSELRRENDRLQTAVQSLDALRAQNAEYQHLLAQSQDLEQLRKDNADLHRLSEEVAKLRAQAGEVAKLQAENQKLQAANAAVRQRAAAGAAGGGDFFAQAEAEARAEADTIVCINNMKQIGLAGRIWAGDNNNIYPPDFLNMTNELSNPVILKCPADKSRKTPDWADVAAGRISYQMVSPGVNDENPFVVFARCPIHGIVTLVDGSVQRLGTNYANRVKQENGKTVLSR